MDDRELDRLTSVPRPREIVRHLMQKELLCKHEIIAEWCAECRHDKPASIKLVLFEENRKIVENLLSWNHTT